MLSNSQCLCVAVEVLGSQDTQVVVWSSRIFLQVVEGLEFFDTHAL